MTATVSATPRKLRLLRLAYRDSTTGRVGLTIRELARRSGISHTTIHELERGRRVARDSTLAKLADTLRADVEDLVGEPGGRR